MKKLLFYTFFCFSLMVQDLSALSPSTAAGLAEKIEQQDQSVFEGFQMISENVVYPFQRSTYQLTAQLWRNETTQEAVIVFHTPKEEGILALRGLAARFFNLEETLKYTREQGRLYNTLVKDKYPELAGGLAQRAAAIVTDYAAWGLMGAGRGLATLAKKGADLAQSYWSGQSAEMQQPGAAAASAAVALQEDAPKIQMIDKGFVAALTKLYDSFKPDLTDFDGQLFLVGHSLAGYVAQYLAYVHELDGYSFGSMGLGLERSVDTDKTFINIIRKNDHFGDLHHAHYGAVKRIQDLPLSVIDNLEAEIAELQKYGDNIAKRYQIMGEYLTKNHAIGGYAKQLAQFESPENTPRAQKLSNDNSDLAAASASHMDDAAAAATTVTTTQAPLAVLPPPLPSPVPSAVSTTSTVVDVVESSSEDDGAASTVATTTTSSAPLQLPPPPPSIVAPPKQPSPPLPAFAPPPPPMPAAKESSEIAEAAPPAGLLGQIQAGTTLRSKDEQKPLAEPKGNNSLVDTLAGQLDARRAALGEKGGALAAEDDDEGWSSDDES